MRLLAPPARDDHLSWHRVVVDGRAASYGLGGDSGPPVVFLHGWALGSHAYKRAIKRLIARGCQVYAPALPGFGGTAPLPAHRMNLGGYAGWVDAFMEAVGIDEPALVIGHSFGGGVAVQLAHAHPRRVSYLVLLNAIGGVSARPIWKWTTAFWREMWPLPAAVGAARAAASEFVPNLIRNPLGVLNVAHLAQSADLRAELAELRARSLPVLVLTSEGDSVIPHDAFETLCDSVGTDGRVVSGGHSWLLADPDSFGEALASVVDVQVAAHRTQRAASRAQELTSLLSTVKGGGRTARALVRDAPALWLMSDPAPVLAVDLALCHPKLRPGEVRAVARPMESRGEIRLTIVAHDRRRLLADSAAVLAASGLSISRASAATWRELALHSFIVRGGMDDRAWSRLGDDLRAMADSPAPARPQRRFRPIRLTVEGSEAGNQWMVSLTMRDRVGLLSYVCRSFSELGINIESLYASAGGGIAKATFLLAGEVDESVLRRAL